MKRILSALRSLAVFAAVAPAAFGAFAQAPQPPEIAARTYMLVDVTANQVLAAKDIDAPVEQASLTKLMTGYLVFDETYYVKGAYSLLTQGFEGAWEGEDANTHFLNGDYSSALTTNPDYVVHPPLGKWLMAIGQALFGTDNGLGWRFTTAALGVASVLLIVYVALRLFRSPLLAGFAGLAMALDGIVMSGIKE